MFFLLLLCLFSCHTPEDAQEFLETKAEFENNWWESDNWGVCLLVDPNVEMVVFDDGDDKEFYPYEFEAPNIYHLEDYTAKVFPNEWCWDIVVGLAHETVCECTL